jgi:hypothetical protein
MARHEDVTSYSTNDKSKGKDTSVKSVKYVFLVTHPLSLLLTSTMHFSTTERVCFYKKCFYHTKTYSRSKIVARTDVIRKITLIRYKIIFHNWEILETHLFCLKFRVFFSIWIILSCVFLKVKVQCI